MKSLKLAILNIKKNIKNEKELRSAFIMSVVGMAINNIAFLFLWYYFGKTVGELNGWKPMDIFGLYAYSGISYGLVTAFFAGIFVLPKYICTGSLDKYLLTPKNILVKISTSKITTSAFGDLIFGIICFVIFAISRHLTLIQLLISLMLVITTSIIFYSFSLICGCISFYLLDGDNVSQGLYGLFISNSLYHGGAFTGILRAVFTFIIPSLLIGTIPVELITDFNIPKLLIIIISTIVWFIISILFFNKSLKKYESNSLFGFGN